MKNYNVVRIEDIEGDNNRGWQVDEIKLETDEGKEIGYIKLAYIPYKRFSSHYPNILYFLSKIKGWCGFDKFYEEGRWSEIAIRANLHDRSIGDANIERRKLSLEEWEEKGRLTLKQLEEKYMWQFKNFRNYFVDKLCVDYAKVNEKFQGQKYYLKLYYEALEWAKEQELQLYTSGLKTKQAKLIFSSYVNGYKIEGNNEFPHSFHGRDPQKRMERFRVTRVIV